MLDPLDFQKRPLIDKLNRTRRAAFFVDLIETLTLCFWRPLSWSCLFFGLWLLQIPVTFGQTAAIGTALIFGLGLFYFLFRDLRHFRWPRTDSLNRRIERDSGIAHRPILSLEDTLSNPALSETRSLWLTRRDALLNIFPRLKVGMPRALVAVRDPHALRLFAVMLFIVGILVAGPTWQERIFTGIAPISFEKGRAIDKSISLWITPPQYTGAGQILLQGSGKDSKTLEIPDGSILKASVFGGIGKPVLTIDKQSWELSGNGENNYLVEMVMPKGETLSIRQFFITRSQWNFKIVPDNAPVIALKAEPIVLPEGTLRFPLMVYDDYGVKNISVTMKLDEAVEDVTPIGTAVTETRSILSPPKTEFEIAPVFDFTAHPWAGLPVTLSFTAFDQKGQSMNLAPIKMVLPERNFSHPVAKSLIAARKKLIWNPANDYGALGRDIESLLQFPHHFQDDIVVFLSIRTAASRLLHNAHEPSLQTAKAIIALLWDTALRVEDGDLTLAARNLRDVQAALDEALQDPNTTSEEISALMQELRQAMAEYFTELGREMQKRMDQGQEFPIVPPEMLSQMISPDALSEFLEQMEAQLLSGDKDAAQQMLSQLQRMMDMPLPPDMQSMRDDINELEQLIQRQEALRDQTQAQANTLNFSLGDFQDFGMQIAPDARLLKDWGIEDMPPAPDISAQRQRGPDTTRNREEQEALRFILGQLMLDADRALNEIPENMGLAEREMLKSSTALGQNLPAESVPFQNQAITYLKQAQEQIAQQFIARMQQLTGFAISGGSGMRYDPLGRPYGGDGDQNGPNPGSRVKIPEAAERKKALEILRLLRERAGEMNRPPEELDYYRRLLRQF
jgi:uncharacterized protein (TIGR02302 family)